MKKLLRVSVLLLCCAINLSLRAQTPVISSYPSATAVIYIDFDGHLVSGTSWNYNGPIACEGSGLSAPQIAEIMDRVAEDYRPFNINITTDSVAFLAAPVRSRMRVIVTTSSSWYGSAGGVAFTGSFKLADDTPAFVFSALLGYNVKNIAEAIAHEAGHTLGLYHQSQYDANCAKVSDYHSGSGSGEIGWAPIMGVGYYRNFTLWHNGSSPYGCTDYQSDLDVITSAYNGFGYRTDDHSNTIGTGTLTNFTANSFTVDGIIERSNDRDYFKFVVPTAGRFSLDAIPYNVGAGNAGSDLDLQVSLYSGAQNLLNVYNPGTLLSSVIDTSLAAGTYYLMVEGRGNQYAPAYASLGSYALRATIGTGTALPLRTLALTGTLSGDKHKLNWLIDADEQVIEQVLEIAPEGRSFVPLTTVDPSLRSYVYRPQTAGTGYYRIKVTFDNGRYFYSNVATIKQDGSSTGPKLINTVATNRAVRVNCPGRFDYQLIDFSGKRVAGGQLTAGIQTITLPNAASGIYIISFTQDGQQWTEKFVNP